MLKPTYQKRSLPNYEGNVRLGGPMKAVIIFIFENGTQIFHSPELLFMKMHFCSGKTYLSPVCLRSWSFRLPLVLKLSPQPYEHEKGFSFLWIRMWDFKFCLSVKSFPQPVTVQRKGWFPLCMCIWVRMRVLRVKRLLQPGNWQAKGLIAWSRSCRSSWTSAHSSSSSSLMLSLSSSWYSPLNCDA